MTTTAMTQGSRIPSVNRTSVRSHGRTSDLLAGGLGRSHGFGERSILWVCDRCFKYMADGVTAELHGVRWILSYFFSTRTGTEVSAGGCAEEVYPGDSSGAEGIPAGCAYHLGGRWCEG